MKLSLGPVAPRDALDVIAVLVTASDLSRDTAIAELDAALDGSLTKAIAIDEFTAKKDSSLVVAAYGKIKTKKIILIAVPSGDDALATRVAAVKAARLVNAEKGEKLGLILGVGATAAAVRAAAEGVLMGAYRFTKYFTGDRKPKKSLTAATIALRTEKAAKKGAKAAPVAKGELEAALRQGEGVGNAINVVRDLVNEPPNELTPHELAQRAKALCSENGFEIKIFDDKKILAENMHLLHAVGRGSTNKPRFVHMIYKPAKAKKGRKRLVVVGKGLTFDSGGLCIKQAPGMGDMKCDMAGAAISVGLMAAVAALQPDVEVHSIFAAAENMPDADAYRPGDVWPSLDGKFVEIINTDAEGRLVLADALAYAAKLEPDVLIDHATLTGACMIALGSTTAGMYSNDDDLAAKYVAASKAAGESLWHMPLIEDLRDSMKSECADLKHTGDRYGGSIIGGLFLREFIGKSKHWIHMDIAGPAFLDRVTPLSPKGGTGYGLLTLVQFLESMAAE